MSLTVTDYAMPSDGQTSPMNQALLTQDGLTLAKFIMVSAEAVAFAGLLTFLLTQKNTSKTLIFSAAALLTSFVAATLQFNHVTQIGYALGYFTLVAR